mmetsp:Transcript_25366/g.69913  ORF Transcript_25366/g.69913 Transcript_25366/m.69913 type:complete len:89 (+) Transcript_25366:780-1046(+)
MLRTYNKAERVRNDLVNRCLEDMVEEGQKLFPSDWQPRRCALYSFPPTTFAQVCCFNFFCVKPVDEKESNCDFDFELHGCFEIERQSR